MWSATKHEDTAQPSIGTPAICYLCLCFCAEEADYAMTGMVIHSGGPSAVLNASLAGVLEESKAAGLRRILGARYGVAGLIAGEWADLSSLTAEKVAAIRVAPGSVLGSSRKKIEPDDAARLMDPLRSLGVDILFLTGGNGSMKTARLLHETAVRNQAALRVIGIPKTIDNDLMETDHTPGFGSAARFFAHAVRDIGSDNRALPPPVSLIEVIGRNTGWVAGATALARANSDDPPHLIYMPERPPSIEKICSEIQQVHRRLGYVVVAVCEGVRDPSGNPFDADVDRAGSRQHELASNLGHMLARKVTECTGLRARSEKPGLLGRSCSFMVSATDAAESYLCGVEAVKAAVSGHSGVMVALRRISDDPYRAETFLTPLELVAGHERPVPADWITPEGNGVREEFLRYVRPLVGEVHAHFRL
jgi:6-phosphofructokinase